MKFMQLIFPLTNAPKIHELPAIQAYVFLGVFDSFLRRRELLAWTQSHIDSDMLGLPMIALGLAVDDTIHFLHRYRGELIRGVAKREALDTVFQFGGSRHYHLHGCAGRRVIAVGVFPGTQFVDDGYLSGRGNFERRGGRSAPTPGHDSAGLDSFWHCPKLKKTDKNSL